MENNTINPINTSDIKTGVTSMEQTQTSSVISQQTKKYSKLNVVILIVIVLLAITSIVLAGVFLYNNNNSNNDDNNNVTPTPTVSPTITSSPSLSPTAIPTTTTVAWKTYSNTSYSFKYPPTWDISLESGEQLNVEGENSSFVVNTGGIGIDVGQHDTYNEFAIQVDGQNTTAKEYTWNSGSTDFLIAFEVTHNGTRYGFRLGGKRGVDRASARATLMKMLESFKFNA